jgi:hypothetical protein
MADRSQRPGPANPQPPISQPARSRGDRLIGEKHDSPNKRPIVGADVADESKGRHSEIEVEAGHHGGKRGDDE